jgi:hypothetical protein
MPKDLISDAPAGNSNELCSLPKSSPTELYQKGYQQALHDFAVTQLLHHLKDRDDSNGAWVALEEQEAETLAAILIQALTAHLDAQLFVRYVEAMRHSKFDASNRLSSLALSQPALDLPSKFPDVEMPRFLYGDRLRWISNGQATDWGIAIGRFYSFAPHCCRWAWCYLIWLDPDSPSSAWVTADTAWESDLELLETEDAL